MNKKIFILFFGLFLIISTINVFSITINTTVLYPNISNQTIGFGWNFAINNNTLWMIDGVNKTTQQTSLYVKLLEYNTSTIIGSAIFNGNYANFSSQKIILNSSKKYSIVTSSNGSLYTLNYVFSGASYPINNPYINWTSGYYEGLTPTPESFTQYLGGIVSINLLPPNFTITNKNNYNNILINNFSAIIDGTTYNTTIGIIITPFLVNDITLKNITIISNNMFNKTYLNQNITTSLSATQEQYPIIYLSNRWNNSNITNSKIIIDGIDYTTNNTEIFVPYNTTKIIYTSVNNYINTTNNVTILQNSNTKINISQSIINFSCFEKISGNQLSCQQGVIYPNAGNYVFNLSVLGYYNLTNNQTINFLDNKTINTTGFYSSNLSINSTFYTGSDNNCNYTIQGITYPSYIETIVNGNKTSVGLINGTYNITDSCQGYTIDSKLKTITSQLESVTFLLYKSNSVLFNIFDVSTLTLINSSTSTIAMQGLLNSYTFTTTNGTVYTENLASDVYSITASNPNYANSFQTVTLDNTQHFNINFYLINTTNLFQFFTISNSGTDNGNKISGATCTFYYPNNGSTLTIGSFITDFSGSGTIYLDTTKTYSFICQATGYQPYQNVIKPIVASSPYTIPMTDTGSNPYTNVLNGLIASTSMSYSYPSTTAYFYFNLNSVNGTTQFFGMSTTYNGTPFLINQTASPSGGLLTLNVTNLTLSNRTVRITYWYKVVGYDYQTWNTYYYLPVIVGGNMTLTQGIFTGNNSITDTNANPMNPVALGFIAVLIPIFFMLFMHMFGMPKVIVILSGLAGDGIVIMSDMFSAMPNATKIGTVLAMSMTIIFMFLIADNKDSVGLN